MALEEEDDFLLDLLTYVCPVSGKKRTAGNFDVNLPHPKVPCSHVVEMAKAQVESNPHASPALKEFARIRPEDAETACHEVLTKYGFSVPIPVETLNIGPGQLKACPFVRPSAWATYLLNKGILPRQLVGVADRAQMEETLREHWKRYQVLFPNHPIFRLALEGTVQLQRCVPILSHSDEGRSTKHLPLFVMSFHGALGRGTQLYVQKQKPLILACCEGCDIPQAL
ncbi:unnamed protein product [Durusdinium trenchii]|uniref:Uncharacterized protein n=1 Tax=Durusdinium trenchii TaxID=1381693 RepID=A0ABP0H7U2_9DINO